MTHKDRKSKRVKPSLKITKIVVRTGGANTGICGGVTNEQCC